jgi:hypothetical protein
VYTSLAVVTVSPRTCSGLAYSGVIARLGPRERLIVLAECGIQQLGDAEVEQLHSTLGETRMFPGLISR